MHPVFRVSLSLALIFFASISIAHAGTDISKWPNWQQWPDTDFSKHSVKPTEFLAGGPPKDGIPAIDDPEFELASKVALDPKEPVIGVEINGMARAYPISIFMWHEIVNDELNGHPITVTFCPLCNAAVVFDRIVDGKVTTFGVSGILRNSDMVMYDRTTLSWWQQFTGQAIVGAQTGKTLTRRPAQFISFAQFKEAFPNGKVMIPPADARRPYGRNPYVDYDTSGRPFNVFAKPPKGFSMMERVVVVDDEAWRMTKIAKTGTVLNKDIRLKWTSGQVSALDTSVIAEGRDVGSVLVERRTQDGDWELIPYDVVFAFVFAAFQPDGTWHG